MSNENQKDNNKVSIMSFIILFLISIVIFAIVYFLHSKNIENRFNRTLQNYEKSINLIFENAITNNGSNENIYSAKEDLKLSFEVGFKMLESSMNEIMKNSNDILQFWFAFLSVIMIVFTIIGFFLNNNILENEKKQLEIVEKEARISRENIEKETKKLIEENNKNIQEYNLFNLGIQSANSKDYKLAIYYFNEVIKLNPKNYQAYNNIGNIKFALGQKEDAIKIYDKSIELNYNNNIDAYYNRGIAKAKSDKYNEAIEDYNKAIELNTDFAEAYNNRGIAKYNLANGKNEIEYNELLNSAIKDYDKSIELNNDYYETYYNRALASSDLANSKIRQNKKEEYNKLIKEAHNDFNKSYSLVYNNDKLKNEIEKQLINLAKEKNEAAIKFCEEHNIDYKNYKE
ncbi:tetratricopeptide repeat protein [Brachyspira aalborgi]|uniref:Tetratricopeptide repeat protein n=1 Tax=Brachyspira aalborgi TaxID=29522 RepID=A0A5C8GD12_9SPIR|nr:tetratricopeptide repeat protein [Brachyspira aalborgi]TXJ59790.1 tetratricopeptide repeat protein [Brachyspira aalborgi]